MITGTGVHDRTDQPFKITGIRTHRADELMIGKELPVDLRGVLGELKWSSQHPDGGGYDDQSKTASGTIWAAAIVVTGSTAGGRTR